ncbi:hypothetical protein G7046_g5901 [Stylonectria norvegica]|nr:hypothetical protein G7046_g5901 [Stylonectria norvegica]
MAIQTKVARVSSIALRICSVVFFRLFPAHFPSIAFALFAIYVPSFFASFFSEPPLEVVDDYVDITVKESTITPDTPSKSRRRAPVEPKPEVVVDEVDVTENILLREKPVKWWKILLSGVPSVRRPIASSLTFLINLALVSLVADALYRARLYYPADDLSFVRLGYVSPTEAKFLLREPDQSQMPVTLEIHIKDAQPPFDNTLWQTAGGVRWTQNSTDYTAALTVPLQHSHQRRYEWRTSNNHTGEFISPPKPGKSSEYHDGKFTFLSTSCILPRFPYNPLDHALAIPGLRHLAAKLPELGAQFMLFLGDFIYVDVPERFGKTAAEYRMQYRQVYASPDWAPVAQNLSWIHVLDDHEIANDWSSNNTGVYKAAVDPWHIYQADLNPPKPVIAGTSIQRQAATWYEFEQGPASFFMMDTRSYRSSNNLPFESTEKSMLGPDQLADLLAWLARPVSKGIQWKFIASSVPFTHNWPVNVKDTWGGFLVERKQIMEAMWDAGLQGTGVVVLSGDRHEFAATKFVPPPESRWPESAAAHEFSTSPLNQFAIPFPTYKQTDDIDVMLRYIPGGTSKFGSFTIEKVNGHSTLLYRLFIDGQETWTTVVDAPPEPPVEKSTSFWDKIKSNYAVYM